jgi:hypothetical protein
MLQSDVVILVLRVTGLAGALSADIGHRHRMTATHARNIMSLFTWCVTGGVTNGKCRRNPCMGNINHCTEARGAAGAGQQARGVTLEPERPFNR